MDGLYPRDLASRHSGRHNPAMPARPLTLPVLGRQVPKRGNALSRALAVLALKLTGWRIEGEFPNVSKFVLIVAPHTSNWEFPLGLMAMYAIGLRGAFLAKHTLFRWPIGVVMRWLGGIPVDRSSAHNVVFQTTALFRNRPHLILVVTPDGTRKKLPKWRTGFWYVARGAGVPIMPIAFDYSAKLFRFRPLFYPTGERDADFEALRANFHAGMAKYPDQY
jgi:1-acyl-sn-glycerol-3-phosphate acyltransferase